MTFVVKSNFFGNFKTGDNVVYNLEILNYFYGLYNSGNPRIKALLIKPIVTWLMSITEAVLHDFYERIKYHTFEGVINVTKIETKYIRNKEIDKLDKYIQHARRNDFFDAKNTRFYAVIDKLRIIRNRIHIQNDKRAKPLHEYNLFTEQVKTAAEKCTELVLKTMSRKYYRDESLHNVKDLICPWSEYFPNKNNQS
jgi:hypothetical protein